jgi:hypothetical protein
VPQVWSVVPAPRIRGLAVGRRGVILYHAARDAPTADSILADGFSDAGGYDTTDQWWEGVWLFDLRLLEGENAPGGQKLVVSVEIPPEVADRFHGAAQGITYREWLIPAAVLNRYPRALVGDAH